MRVVDPPVGSTTSGPHLVPASMPPKSPRLSLPRHCVTAVLVTHDGARWLPETLAALAAQTRPPQRVVAVDAGSTDGSHQLLVDALGESAVLTAARTTAPGAAVQAGLDAFAGAAVPPGISADATDWVWILHDDCAPDPGALSALLERAEESPTAEVLGPKLISWDRRQLLEVGVTIDGTGRRETGIDPREADQGQHDTVSDVLAVSSAGMLVRRTTWDRLGGMDPALALYGDDLDLGWRVTAAGGRVLVAPAATVRHAGALDAGLRTPDAVTGRPGATRRAHGMRVVLTNTSGLLVVGYALRFVVESLLRAVVLLLLRRVAAASDELIGLAMLLRHPAGIVRARAARRRHRLRRHRELRGLLAPPSGRLHRLGDSLSQTRHRDGNPGLRRASVASIESGPVADEAESFDIDDLGVLSRLARAPVVVLVVALLGASLLAYRDVLGAGLHGGRLLPAPAGAGTLWSTYLEGWHAVGLGSSQAAPPSLAALALLSVPLLGHVGALLELLTIGAVPLAGLSAYVALGGLTRRPLLRTGAAAAYALLPALTAAVSQGRVDVTAAAVLLPLVARLCVAAVRTDQRQAGWHRCASAGLLLALVTALVPLVWVVAVPVLVATALPGGAAGRLRRATAALATVAVAPLALLPWTGFAVRHPEQAFRGLGLPEPLTSRFPVDASHLMLLHPGGPGEPPWWALVPLVLTAVFATAFIRRGAAARVAAAALVLAATAAVVVTRALSSSPDASGSRAWTGGVLLLGGAAMVVALVVALDGAPELLRRSAFGWRQPVAASLAVGLAASALLVAGHWLVRPDVGREGTIQTGRSAILPQFAVAAAQAPTSPRVLALTVSGGLVRYALLRGDQGLRVGDPDVTVDPARTPGRARRALDELVRHLSAGVPGTAGELAGFGIALVVVPSDAGGVLSRIARVPGLARVPATTTIVYRLLGPAGELRLLDARGASAARGGALVSGGNLLPATAGAAHPRLPTGPVGRLLVLAEPRSPAWRATLDGRALPPTTAYGWAQAWEMPPGGGRLQVSRADAGASGWHWLQLAVVGLLLLLCLPSRRQTTDADLADPVDAQVAA